ncbi:hypothetical protein GN244_ATG10746 [Phytophthora infestans]|uniref:Uncharacterized protein n=1 Tax=Phytophthora infestans TaxID=4787 RepID=A0A833T5F1_PHYIN|nr:hypothetical protein GN244_ATG10746 [Phytophthora infestans]
MDKQSLSVAIALLPSTGAGSSTIDALLGHSTVSTAGPSRRTAVYRQGASSDSGSSSHEATIGEAIQDEFLPTKTDHSPHVPASKLESIIGSAEVAVFSHSSSPPLFYPNFNAARSSTASPGSIHNLHNIDEAIPNQKASTAGSASNDENGTARDAGSFTSSRSDFDSEASALSLHELSSSSENASESTADTIGVSNYYSAGTVAPFKERAEIQSTALELSTSAAQVEDILLLSPSYGRKTASTIDQTTSSNQVDDRDGITSNLTNSNTSTERPLVYVCVVLGVAGLVGAVILAKRRQHNSDEEGATEASAVMSRAAWGQQDNRVREIIDRNNIVQL